MENLLGNVDKALSGLKTQGLPIQSFVTADGDFVFDVKGYLLTSDQILMLQEKGQLNLQGIIDFDVSERAFVEKDILSARKRIQPEELKSWTARTICAYINEEFGRNHSVGQIRAVLNRLGIEYAKT